jgi:uncharacterized membrane protein
VLAYFMPFFTSLLLLFSRSREIRFHAVQCALIDLLTMVYIVAGMIPIMIYSSIRYGSDEIPSDDVPFNVFMVSFMVLPLVLRIYCLVELARKGTVRVKFLGALANRVAGRPPAGGRSAQSIGGPWRG